MKINNGLTEQDIQNLSSMWYQPEDRNRSSLVSFIEGYLIAKNDDRLEKNISDLISHIDNIDCLFNTLIEQIDHYAFNNNKDIYDGFTDLIYKLYNYKDEIPSVKDYPFKTKWLSPSGIKLGESINKNGSIKVGDCIQLGDKILDDYKKTKFYDSDIRNPSWDLFYSSTFDFKYVSFYHLDVENNSYQMVDHAWRILSNSVLKIKFLSYEKNELVAYTEIFRIEIAKALESNEITLVTSKKKPLNEEQIAISLKNSLLANRNGIIDIPIEKIISDWCYSHIGMFNLTWCNYNRSMNHGRWLKISS